MKAKLRDSWPTGKPETMAGALPFITIENRAKKLRNSPGATEV
jgi:hypothetical protein